MHNHKLSLFLILLTFLMPTIVWALDSGDQYVFEISSFCYDNSLITVRANGTIIQGEYDFPNCNEVMTNKWNCPCDKAVMTTKNDTVQLYSIHIEYERRGILDSKVDGGVIWKKKSDLLLGKIQHPTIDSRTQEQIQQEEAQAIKDAEAGLNKQEKKTIDDEILVSPPRPPGMEVLWYSLAALLLLGMIAVGLYLFLQ